MINFHLPLSIGGYSRPNRAEGEAAADVVKDLMTRPPQRALLVLPTVAPAARRVLMRICEDVPDAAERLVAVNGDGFSINEIYRDGAFAWPVEAMPVPLLLFAQNNPVAWAETGPAASHPNGTDDVLHFADMMKIVSGKTVFGNPSAGTAITARELAERACSHGRRPCSTLLMAIGSAERANTFSNCYPARPSQAPIPERLHP